MAYDLSEINFKTVSDPRGLIEEGDAIYHANVETAAEKIADNIKNSPIVLLSGPSGSGKTTTAMKVSEALERRGIRSHYVGMDDYLYEHLMEISMVERARRFSPAVRDINDILKAHRMGLTWARLLMDDFVSHLDTVLQLIRALLDPHCIILGGDIPDVLRDCPELLPAGDYQLGERYEDSCALGAAVIAMQEALHAMIAQALGE